MTKQNKSQLTHTPGPWRLIDESEHGNFTDIETTDEYASIRVIGENRLANGHLIAAATELLEALEITHARLVEERDTLCDELQILEMQKGYAYLMKSATYARYAALKIECQQAAAVIAKARGQQ